MCRVNETSVRVTREGDEIFSLQLDGGITYQLRRRREQPGLWMVGDQDIFRRELDMKVVKFSDVW